MQDKAVYIYKLKYMCLYFLLFGFLNYQSNQQRIKYVTFFIFNYFTGNAKYASFPFLKFSLKLLYKYIVQEYFAMTNIAHIVNDY